MSAVHESKTVNQWRKKIILFLILFHTSHWFPQFTQSWSNFECGPFDQMIMAPDWLICLHGYITPKVFTSELEWQSFLSPWQPLVEVTMVMKVFTSVPAPVQEGRFVVFVKTKEVSGEFEFSVVMLFWHLQARGSQWPNTGWGKESCPQRSGLQRICLSNKTLRFTGVFA